MKRSIKVCLIILLAFVVIFGIWVFFLLVNKLSITKRDLGISQRKLEESQNELKETREHLQKVKVELGDTQRELNIVNDKLNSSEKNNLALLEEKNRLEAKLHSLKELKEAIKQVKLEYHQQKVQRYLILKEQQKEIDAQELAHGNRGFLIKNGHSLYQPNIKIEVKPAY